jgi:hypothetical protein
LLLLLAVGRRVRVRLGKDQDTLPAARLPDMVIAVEPRPDDGPVLIQVEYRIDKTDRDAFLRIMRKMGPTRRRNGATSWRVFRDLSEEGLFVERYIIDSWAEYVRLRSRMTIADRQLQEVARFQAPIRRSAYRACLAWICPRVNRARLRARQAPRRGSRAAACWRPARNDRTRRCRHWRDMLAAFGTRRPRRRAEPARDFDTARRPARDVDIVRPVPVR